MNHPTINKKSRGSRGFTILELLIAVIIIGILVAIIVPVLANRANEARIAATKSDLESIQTAEQHAAIDTGYFYRLYVLDDTKGGDGSLGSDNVADVWDGIRDERFRGDVPDPEMIFIDVQSQVLLDAASSDVKYTALSNNETTFNWNGPYLNVARKLPVGQAPTGIPIDPYSSPYMLFTKAGLLLEPDGIFVATATVGGQSYNAQIFDRPTILSLGANAAPGDGTGPGNPDGQFGKGDDIFRQF